MTKKSFITRFSTVVIFVMAALWGKAVLSAEHTINAVGVKFDPIFIYIEPGDTINWEGMAGHNIETIDAMVPEGLEKILSDLGDNVSVTFESEGIIVYKCTPHWGARLGGIIVVGKPEDPGAILDAYLAAIENDRAGLLPAKGLLKKVRKDMESKDLL